jgi:hypothetical protein
LTVSCIQSGSTVTSRSRLQIVLVISTKFQNQRTTTPYDYFFENSHNKKNQTLSQDNLQTTPSFIQDLVDFESTAADLTSHALLAPEVK